MKRLIVTLMVGLPITFVYGQSKDAHTRSVQKTNTVTMAMSKEQDREIESQHLIYLNSLYIQSYIKSDTPTFDKLLWAEEFTQTNPDGTVLSRNQTMERFGKPRFDKIVYLYVKDVKVTFLSADKAVVAAVNPDCFEVEGKLVQSVSTYEDTYVKRDGKWKCIAAVIKNF